MWEIFGRLFFFKFSLHWGHFESVVFTHFPERDLNDLEVFTLFKANIFLFFIWDQGF